jgi:uncharacterized membrane protein YvbJ
MYCRKCGKQVADNASYCPYCGENLQQRNYYYTQAYYTQPYYTQPMANKPQDKPSMAFDVLAFFFPLIGLILYLAWLSKYPIRAKEVGMWALVGEAVNVALTLLITFFYVTLIFGSFFSCI